MPGGSDLGPCSSRSSSSISGQHQLQHFYLQHPQNGGGDFAEDDDDEEEGSIIPDRAGKHHFCRLCLTHSERLNPLFPVNSGPDQILLAQILDCVDVQITLPDDIKSLICTECIQQIYSFASFKELCKSNDQLLKSQTFAQESDNEDPHEIRPATSPEVTIVQEEYKLVPDATLLEKLQEQGVVVEAIGQPSSGVQGDSANLNADEREAERKAKNAARMRRWRLRQRQKQEQQLGVVPKEEIIDATHPEPIDVEPETPPQIDHTAQLKQEEALRIQQAQELFALLAQQQLRQVEAEIRRLKAGQVQIQEQIQPFALKSEPLSSEPPEPEGGGESSRQTSPTSEQQLAAVRRSRAEYMRKWRAKRSSQINTSNTYGFVGRPPQQQQQMVASQVTSGETEKLIIQRHNRAEYMRRWRRERLKQELSPGEFDDWCSKSEQRRRFREWQVVRESGASSAGDETTMDCGGDADTEQSLCGTVVDRS